MDKRYQVFVSSTYEDLREERSAAILSLLKLKCIPAGMEIFPSSDDAVWEIIQKTIQESDYYILIIASHYGSISNDGKTSWTEREYDYAQHIKKPTFVFFYKELGEMKINDIDDKDKLVAFREKVKGRMLRTCHSIDNLQTEITIAIANAKDNIPAVGWVRADKLPSNIESQSENPIEAAPPLQLLDNPITRQMQTEQFTDWLIDSLHTLKNNDTEGTNEALLELTAETLHYRDAYLDWLQTEILVKDNVDKWIIKILERIAGEVPVLRPQDITPATPMGYYGFFIGELAIYTIAKLFKYGFYKDIYNVMTNEYIVNTKIPNREFHERKSFCNLINSFYGLPNDIIKTPDGGNYYSSTAELILKRIKKPKHKQELLNADLIMCQLSFIYQPILTGIDTSIWYPCTIAYNDYHFNDGARYIWKDMKKKSECEKMLPLFGVDNINDLKKIIKDNPISQSLKNSDIYKYPDITDSVKIDEIASMK